MNNLLKTPIGRLRLTGIAEGISFLSLLVIAMPVKYIMGIPEPVKMVGWLHGLLFILYIFAVINAAIIRKWSIRKVFFSLLASLIPGGPFFLDSHLKKEDIECAVLMPDL